MSGLGRSALLVNATELLRQPGLQRHVEVIVPLADVDVVDDRLGRRHRRRRHADVDDRRHRGRRPADGGLGGHVPALPAPARRRRCVIDVDERYAAADETGHAPRRPGGVPDRARPARPRPDGARGGPARRPRRPAVPPRLPRPVPERAAPTSRPARATAPPRSATSAGPPSTAPLERHGPIRVSGDRVSCGQARTH